MLANTYGVGALVLIKVQPVQVEIVAVPQMLQRPASRNIAVDANYLYVATGANQWKRAAACGVVSNGLGAEKQFGDLITFTRSSAGGRFNERGLFEMVPANQPRFDYDPITRQLRGLFTEETSTNLSTQSNSQLTITPTRATYIDNGQLFIDGVSPLRLLREDATPNATHFGVPPNTSLLADTTYTGSYFVKASGRTKLALWVGTSGGWAPGNPQANFDLVTQTVEERNGAKATISRVTQDIFRITLTAKTGPKSNHIEYLPSYA